MRRGRAVGDVSVDRIAISVCTTEIRRTRAISDAVPLAGHEIPGVVAVLVRAAVGVRGASAISSTDTCCVVGARRRTHPRPARAVIPSARLAHRGALRLIIAVALADVFAVRRRRRLGPTLRSGGAVGDVSVDRIAMSVAAAVCGKTRAQPDSAPRAGHVVPDVVAVLVRAAVGVLGATRGEGVRLAREVGARGRPYPRPARAVVPSAG